MYVCLYVCMYVCIYVSMYLHIRYFPSVCVFGCVLSVRLYVYLYVTCAYLNIQPMVWCIGVTGRKAHTPRQRPTHKCKVCAKEFICASKLDRHETKHTGRKRYHCELCGGGFTQRASLKVHSKYVLPESDCHFIFRAS